MLYSLYNISIIYIEHIKLNKRGINNMAIFIGGESANSFIKMVSSVSKLDVAGNPIVDTYLNTLTEVDKYDAYDEISGALRPQYYEVDSVYYQVGLKAETSEQDNSYLDGIERYKHPNFKIETLIAIYRQLERDNKFDEPIYYVTGVPIKHFNKTVEETIRDVLVANAPHVVNGKPINIKGVKVIKQALSSYYNDLLDNNAKPNADFYLSIKDKNLLYFDIGWGTSDVQRIVDGKPLGDSHLEGVITIVEKIYKDAISLGTIESDKLKALGVPKLGFHNAIKTGILKCSRDTELDMSKSRKKHVSSFLNSVSRLTKSDFELSNIDTVYFCGGGAIALERDIKQHFKEFFGYNDIQMEKKFVFVAGAQQSNARGYYKFALKYFRKDIGVGVVS